MMADGRCGNAGEGCRGFSPKVQAQMTQHTQDDLWRDFPKTATEFKERLATAEDCCK
jgi:hypothetical protein